VDIKPTNMEELTEVITAAEFHPLSCNLFMYSSSKGTIKLADMRESALCDAHAKRASSFLPSPAPFTRLTCFLSRRPLAADRL
jgi:serine/threonine-protein phosphatase 2A regulatory subunit B